MDARPCFIADSMTDYSFHYYNTEMLTEEERQVQLVTDILNDKALYCHRCLRYHLMTTQIMLDNKVVESRFECCDDLIVNTRFW